MGWVDERKTVGVIEKQNYVGVDESRTVGGYTNAELWRRVDEGRTVGGRRKQNCGGYTKAELWGLY